MKIRPFTIEDLALVGRDMRNAQRAYSRARERGENARGQLVAARRLEAKFDSLVKAVLTQNVGVAVAEKD